MRGAGREAIAAAATLALYEARVLPAARRELAGWHRVAATIPDPVLRDAAVGALREKDANPRAIAVFATLAPAPSRRPALRAMIALQVAIDYLDNLGELPGPEPLRDGLRLHRALGAALADRASAEDPYAHHPGRDDGGYLELLTAACREATARLPSRAAVLPHARRAARRCGEGQSHTHAAAAGGGSGELAAWAAGQQAPVEFAWWEVAAGACSSVAAHALLALAAAPAASGAEAEMVDAAYFPAVGALTVLLDDLVDLAADSSRGEHSYLSYYADPTAAANRLATIAAGARLSLDRLPAASRHRAILAGVLAYYLALPTAAGPGAGPARQRLLAAGGPVVRALTVLLRLRGNG